MILNSVSVTGASFRRSSYLICLGIILIGANLRAPITSLGPVLGNLQAELSLSDSTAGVLSSLPLIVFAMLSLTASAASRKLGAERGLGAALVAILIGTLVRSSPFPMAIWIGTVMLSAGIAVANVLLPGIVKRNFPNRAALLIGVYAAAMASFAGIGAGVAAPIAHLQGASWRTALVAPALLTVLALAVWYPQMRGTQHVAGPAPVDSRKHTSPWRQAVGWHVSGFFACHSFIFYSLIAWYAAIASSGGTSVTSAGFGLLLYQVVSVATNLAAAPIIRRATDQRGIGLACGGLQVIGTMGLASSAPHPNLWLMVTGLGAGLSMTTSLSLFALRSVSHEQASELSGMAQFVGYSGAALGPVLFGGLHQATSSWTYSLCALVVASGLVSLFAFLAGRARTMT